MMIEDCGAKILFLDRETGQALEGVGRAGPLNAGRPRRQRRGRAAFELARAGGREAGCG